MSSRSIIIPHLHQYLHSCLKYSRAYHFADNNITLSGSWQETLANTMNYDLRKLSMWLRANKLFLNVEKNRTCCILKTKYRSSCPEVFFKKGVLRNFAKFTGKHLRQSLFFNKVADLGLGLQLY